jgi:hypothetical protein
MLEWTTNGNPINSNSPNTTGELIPYIESFSPSTISATGTTEVLITGGNFIPTNNLSISASTLQITGASSVVYSVISPTKISAIVTTNNASGNLPVIVGNGDRLSNIWGDKSIGITSDPYFQNVVLFLKGEGENDNTSIIDSSPSPKTLIRFGDVRVSTAQKKYGNSSIYFDGSGDYIQINNLSINFTDFTVEAWVYFVGSNPIYLFAGNASGNHEFLVYPNQITIVRSYVAWDLQLSHSTTPNTWNHFAYSRQGSQLRIFKNGVLVHTMTYSNVIVASSFVIIGRDYGANRQSLGYLDHLRISNTARYVSSFNPETDTYLQ